MSRTTHALIATAVLPLALLSACGGEDSASAPATSTSTSTMDTSTMGTSSTTPPASTMAASDANSAAPADSSAAPATTGATPSSAAPAGGQKQLTSAELTKVLTASSGPAGTITVSKELAEMAQKQDAATAIDQMDITPASCAAMMKKTATLLPKGSPLAVGSATAQQGMIQLRSVGSEEVAKQVLQANQQFVTSCPKVTMKMSSVQVSSATNSVPVKATVAQDAVGSNSVATASGAPSTTGYTAMGRVGSVLVQVSVNKGTMADATALLEAVAKNIPTQS